MEFLPVRMLSEFVYCPRLFYLEYVDREFQESVDTLEGHFVHHRVDEKSGSLPSPDEQPFAHFHAHSVVLSSERYGLIAKIDVVEGEGNSVMPIDYKKGSPPSREAAWLPDKVQVCAQGLILRDNGYQCESGIVYYSHSKSKVIIPFTEELIQKVLEFAKNARQVSESGHIPPPLYDSPKCPRCSLVGICLPDETNFLTGHGDKIRNIVPLKEDALPLYVQEQGTTITQSGEELVIRTKDDVLKSVRLIDVSHLAVFGNVQITTQTLHELCERDIPICYFSYGGWFYGITHGMSHKNVFLRQKQFSCAERHDTRLNLSRTFVVGKIRNCRTMVRRNSVSVDEKVLDELESCIEKAKSAENLEELLGIEGNAARIYFSCFSSLLKTDVLSFNFQERNRRPPKDPVNALLSYGYSLMVKDFTVSLLATGFDPFLGFYHAPHYGKPALALDLMEEFRPLIADSVVLTVVNNGEIRAHDFIIRSGAATLTNEGRKTFIRAYERRMETEITHPIFRYSITYRQAIGVQARLLARYLNGEIQEYIPFCTR